MSSGAGECLLSVTGGCGPARLGGATAFATLCLYTALQFAHRIAPRKYNEAPIVEEVVRAGGGPARFPRSSVYGVRGEWRHCVKLAPSFGLSCPQEILESSILGVFPGCGC